MDKRVDTAPFLCYNCINLINTVETLLYEKKAGIQEGGFNI